MRLFPRTRSEQQNKIIWATFNFYGEGLTKKEIPLARDVALFLMGKRRGINLNEQQKNDLWYIKENLKDKVYVKNLIDNPPKTP